MGVQSKKLHRIHKLIGMHKNTEYLKRRSQIDEEMYTFSSFNKHHRISKRKDFLGASVLCQICSKIFCSIFFLSLQKKLFVRPFFNLKGNHLENFDIDVLSSEDTRRNPGRPGCLGDPPSWTWLAPNPPPPHYAQRLLNV